MKEIRMMSRLVFCLLLAGCQVLPERPPPPAVHDFGPAPMATGGHAAPWSAVSVDAPEWLHDPMIRYRLLYAHPTQVRFYLLDRWVAPPPDLLASRLASSRTSAGHELRIELQDFEQTFQQADRSTVRMRFHAEAVNPLNGALAAEHQFVLTRATRSADAAGAVDGFSQLVERAAEAIADWMATLPPPERTAAPK